MRKRVIAFILCLISLASVMPLSVFADITQPQTPLEIIKQPESSLGKLGERMLIPVDAVGDGLTYQWFVRNPGDENYAISSIETNTYSFVLKKGNSGRELYCVIKDQYGNSVTTDTVTVSIAPTQLQIVEQPENGRGQLGERMFTTVTAVGDGLTYKWYVRNPGDKKFTVSSIKTNRYSFYLKKGNSGRELYCVITDQYGNSVTTDIVNVSTPVNVKVVKQPASQYGAVNEQLSAKVVAEGDGLKYRWYEKKSGDTKFVKTDNRTATYAWIPTEEGESRQVFCAMLDAYGNKLNSNTVSLKAAKTLVITKQPSHVGVASGKTASTTVTAIGDELKYQWYYKDPDMAKFKKTSSVDRTYSFKMSKSDSGRQVYCQITDVHGERVNTQVVTLKIPKELKITKEPADALTKLGTLGKSSVKATGDNLQYCWYVKEQGQTKFKKTSVTGSAYTLKMTKDNLGTQAYCLITDMFGNKIKTKTVTFAVAKAEFERAIYKIKPGAKRTLELDIKPGNTIDTVIWTSSNPEIAKVTNKGVVTALKKGTVTITARGQNTGFIASCKVKVCDVKQVAITFDDGPGKYTGELLDFLEENDIRVTFFLVGNRLNAYKSLVKREVEEGHEIGYHSWKHDIQTKLDNSKIVSDYNKSAKILKDISGAEFTLWRAPGGGISDRVLRQIDLPHIMWSADTLDWKYRDSSRTCSVIKSMAKDGSIVLLHDIHKSTVQGAMKALKEMQDGDYEFLTVTELLSRNGSKPKAHASYSKSKSK